MVRLDDKSRMSGDVHVRFRERLEGQFLRATRLVCAFQYQGEAERFYRMLPERLAKFGLKVAPEKTCSHRFSRFHRSRKRRFIFLGFEFYWEADTKGEPRVWRRTARKRLRESIKACKEWIKTHRHYPLQKLIPAMIRKVRGHYNYFRAIGNMTSLWIFHREVVKLLYKWLNRRSQRRSLTWDGIKRVLAVYAFPAPSQPSRAEMNRGLA